MLGELVTLHAHALLRMPWVAALLAAGVGFLVYQFVSAATFAAWTVLTIGVESVRALYASRVLKRANDADPKNVHARFVMLAVVAGAAVATGGVLFLPALPILYQALFGAILFAIPAAGVAVSQSSRYILGGYALAMLVPSSATWCWLHPSQALALGFLTILYCAVLVWVAADGEKLLLRSVVIRHERDRLVRDLEQRNADVQVAVAQAQQSAQARARVLAAASHDLRQPLHALSVYSAVLLTNPPSKVLREVSENIDQIVRSLGSLLNGLLDLSRLSSEYYVPERQPVALDRLLTEVCAECRQPALQKGLVLKLEAAPVHLQGDPVALGRIARNLVDNAIKYTDQGEIRVASYVDVSGAAPVAVLSVADTGRGIPEAEQSRIFEEFYQVDNPGRDRSRGVGLGLTIVHRLCELIHARIEVDSVVGSGTCFKVLIPEPLSDVTSSEEPVTAATEVSLSARYVYVVDDEQDILKGMRTLLRVWGMTVLTADSAGAANLIFEQHGPPELLIVDLRLRGDEHGAQLAARLRREYGPFAVLIVTGETSSEALREAHDTGFSVLQKPIAPEVLRKMVGAALGAVPVGRTYHAEEIASVPDPRIEMRES
jgi:signal transduction histidine kinase/CheY-like chemotaxis protein